MTAQTITIVGINGNVGRAAAVAFVAAGWTVIGFGRSNRQPVDGVRFIAGDAANINDLKSAISEADVVFNALNLPYDKWFDGKAEAQLETVLAAMAGSGKTMLFPGNIYNYAATERHVTPQSPQVPARPRGEIRVRMETMLQTATQNRGIRVIILRAGDFYGETTGADWFGQLILRDASKGRVTLSAHEIGHSWAYLPDLGRAFVRLAEHREDFAAFENFHFAGHYLTAGQIFTALEAVSHRPLKRVKTPWTMLTVVGLISPLLREMVKMRYLWDNPMQLTDQRLDTLLGPAFATPAPTAIGKVGTPFLTPTQQAA